MAIYAKKKMVPAVEVGKISPASAARIRAKADLLTGGAEAPPDEDPKIDLGKRPRKPPKGLKL